MTIYDPGDVVPLQLDVAPFDDSTVASCVVLTPRDTTLEVPVEQGANRGQWLGALRVGYAGEWRARWTVTGTGSGVETHTMRVRPGVPGGAPEPDVTVPGEPTPQPTGPQSYVHEQTLASSVWLILHPLPFSPAGVEVLSADGSRLYPRRITRPGPGRVRLDFPRPVGPGTATLS